MDPNLPDGFSALGGQTRDAYGPFDPAGSSTGSAVSVAANLTTASVGSETQGSIIAPSSVNGVAGLKTSRGLVSRDYIIPLIDWMDVPGPIGRSVTDVAVMLTAMVGTDENDPATADAAELAGVDFTQFLSLEQAQEIRVGVAGMSETIFQQIVDEAEAEVGRALTAEEADTARAGFVDFVGDPQAIATVLNAQGIETVFIDSSVSPIPGTDTFTVIEYAFQDSFDRFMASLGENAPLSSLADVAAFNNENLTNRAPYGQAYVEGSVNTAITAEAYAAMKEGNMQSSAAALRGLFEQYDVDIIAFRVYTQEYAPAGFPALAVPDGLATDGQPVSVVLVGDYLSEPQLLSVGYAYEQGAQGRVEPDLESRMQEIAAVAP